MNSSHSSNLFHCVSYTSGNEHIWLGVDKIIWGLKGLSFEHYSLSFLIIQTLQPKTFDIFWTLVTQYNIVDKKNCKLKTSNLRLIYSYIYLTLNCLFLNTVNKLSQLYHNYDIIWNYFDRFIPVRDRKCEKYPLNCVNLCGDLWT